MYVGELGWEAGILFEEPTELWGVVEYGERVFALAGLVLVVCGFLGDWFGRKDRIRWMVFLVFAETDDGTAGAIDVRRRVAARSYTNSAILTMEADNLDEGTCICPHLSRR